MPTTYISRDYKIINTHMYWGQQSDNSIGHALVLGRLASASYHNTKNTTKPYSSYEEYEKDCKTFGIYDTTEENFNKYMLIEPIPNA